MRIGEAIKQEKFKSENHKLLINLLYTSNWLDLRSSCLFKSFGVTTEQYNVLRILRGQHPKASTINLITERMLNRNSNASRLVEKLRSKGLVQRQECCSDRRAVNVLITSKGLQILAELEGKEDELLSIFDKLETSEAIVLNGFLDRIRS